MLLCGRLYLGVCGCGLRKIIVILIQCIYMKKHLSQILHFLQYHNIVVVILLFVLGFETVILASEEVRDTVIGEKTVEIQGIDKYSNPGD